MVFRRDEKGGGWHEPPYTEEEEFEIYKRISEGMASGKATIYRSQPAAPASTDKPHPKEGPHQEGTPPPDPKRP
jgi:hypothetical protein